MPTARVGSLELYYESHGEGEPPLVLVMGLGGSCRGWLPLQVPELSRDRRVLIYDHRGVGESTDPGEPFRVADLAEDLVGLLDALGLDRVDLLGLFLGGMVAQELVLTRLARVRRLVLVGTFARADAKRRLLLEQWRAVALHGLPPDVWMAERLLWGLQDETLEQTDLIDAMMAFFRREGAPLGAEVFARQCEAALAHDTADRLRAIAHPTLVACGRQDQLTPPRLHRELADEIPDARLVTFSYGGHLVAAESAQRFNAVVDAFLREAD